MKNEKKYISDQKLIAKKIDFFNKLENFTLTNVANLLENHPEYLNMQEEKSGCTLLFKAVSAGNYEIVEFLLDLNADPDKQNIYGETPLHQAVDNGNYKIINILLDRGGNPNIQQLVKLKIYFFF
jgi:ankyrin repeat protein